MSVREDPRAPSFCPTLNFVVGSPNPCEGEGVEYSYYNYNITAWTAYLFVILFGIVTILHVVQGVISKRWFLIPTIATCALAETIGWAGRLWSYKTTEWAANGGGYWYSEYNAFMMQIATLIFAPVFLTAGCVKFYAVVFITGDLLSIVVQALGGAIAAGADTSEDAKRGSNVMVGGVFIQLVVMILYSLLFAEIFWRYHTRRPVKQFRLRKTKPFVVIPDGTISASDVRKTEKLMLAMAFSTILIFARSIYRCIELLDGWDGPIISNEALFCVLDGLMVFLSIAVFNIIHPIWFLPHSPSHNIDGYQNGSSVALAEHKREGST